MTLLAFCASSMLITHGSLELLQAFGLIGAAYSPKMLGMGHVVIGGMLLFSLLFRGK